jgi:uncharacterized protein (TIGR03790 family)
MVASQWRSSALFCAILLTPATCLAIDASNVMVLYNPASSDGVQVAQTYAQIHPGVDLVPLSNVPAGDQITADQYLSIIRPQVMAALGSASNPIDDIVTTKGLPLRIDVTEQFTGSPPTYTDPSGVLHTVWATEQYSSLESELTQVANISTWQQMLDQTWWDPTTKNPSANPYFNFYNSAANSSAFNHANPALGGMYLTSRLDGYNAADVIASLQRAQNAYVGPFNFVVDNDPTKQYNTGMASLVNNVLAPQHQPYTYDNTTAFVGTAPGPVIGYVSNGANQASTPPNFMLNTVTGLQFPLANGAVAETWESYNAYTFTQGGNVGGQSLIADWIHRGGTAAVGTVQEPTASLSTVTNEDIMFNMLLHGYTWAEAAWAATPQLSFVNTVVGDPLMTWKPALPGDATGVGTVGAADLAVLARNWGATGSRGGSMWSQGDFNGDGKVGASDLATFAANWGTSASWANGGVVGQGFGGIPGAGNGNSQPIPEPSTLCLATLAALVGLARANADRFRRKRGTVLVPTRTRPTR